MNGIAHEQRVIGGTVETLQRYPYGFRVWFVSRRRVAPDHRVHIPGQPHVDEPAHRQRFGFAGHDAQLVTLLCKSLDGRHYVVVAADQAFMVRGLVLAVGAEKRCLLDVVS